ncbi:galactokinase [Nocardioides sp. InS609-2]|uniref:galactokinase n=1 Tax=Nocardioides sp. InS609-2 TaxID=2760705 RepID=UPI0020C0F6CB|nr:galactokinase [Nocardioides sp. InS609-2]
MSESRGTWSAPGRVNLIGDHTDYNGGFALPFALPLRTTVTATRRDDRTVVARSGGHAAIEFEVPGTPGEVTGWGAYVAGAAWALAEAGVDVPGADLEIASEVPLGAGLSSSHSLECSVALALTGLAGVELDPTELAKIVQRAENEYAGSPTGLLDQMTILHSRARHLSFFDARALTVEPVACDPAASGLELLVIDSNAPHQLVDGAYASRRHACEAAARRLGVETLREVEDVDAALVALADDPETQRRARHVLTENHRVLDAVALVRGGRLAEIGPLLTASHVSMRDDFENTVPAVDLIVETAIEGGALGARMTGGGFGGAVIALVPVVRRVAVERAVTTAALGAGLTAPSYLPVVPSPGAGRDA